MGEKRKMKGSGIRIGTGMAEVHGGMLVVIGSIVLEKAVTTRSATV